jgi:hypothetical protein
MSDHPLNPRELQLIDVLIAMHQEFGIAAEFTSAAIGHITGPCAGSLAGLTLHGYASQRVRKGEVVYRLAEKGFALYAGVDLPT